MNSLRMDEPLWGASKGQPSHRSFRRQTTPRGQSSCRDLSAPRPSKSRAARIFSVLRHVPWREGRKQVSFFCSWFKDGYVYLDEAVCPGDRGLWYPQRHKYLMLLKNISNIKSWNILSVIIPSYAFASNNRCG